MTAIGYDEDDYCTGACCNDAAALTTSCATALERIRLVSAWYADRIIQERIAHPDVPTPGWLTTAQRQCLQDQRTLSHSSQARIDRLAEEYAVRYHQLTATLVEAQPSVPAPVPTAPAFFICGPLYTSRRPRWGKGGLAVEFRARMIDKIPGTDALVAFGIRRWEGDTRWYPDFKSEWDFPAFRIKSED
jgi:hypothetical protein